jgi:hypothetical protein
MKGVTRTLAIIAAFAATIGVQSSDAAEREDIHPIANPVYSDTAVPRNRASLIYAYHSLPSKVSIIGGGTVALDGHAEVWALQLELKLTDDLSFVAVKDGYTTIDPDSDSPLDDESGFNDIAAGLKWRIHNDDGLSVALRGLIEFANGDDDVFQGNGDGNFSPAIIASHDSETAFCNAVVGAVFPFDDEEESTVGYISVGYGYKLSDTIIPMLELNWFHVIDEGEGKATFSTNAGGGVVPANVTFEGGDLFHLGAANAEDDPSQATLSVGARFLLSDSVSLGLSYEWMLTDEEESLFDDRFNANLTIRF